MDEEEKLPPPEAMPVVVRTYDQRRSSREGIGLGQPKVTERLDHTTREFRAEIKRWLPIYKKYADQRPKVRGDCVGGERPCVFVSCKYNNYLDVKTSGGTKGKSIIYNFPDTEPQDVPPERSCALDIADEGGATLEDVAKLTNLTRERVRQVQAKAMVNLEGILEDEGVIEADDIRANRCMQRPSERSLLRFRKNAAKEPSLEEPVFISTDEVSLTDGDAVSFFSDSADDLLTSRIFRIYMRESIEKGYAKRPKSDRQKKLEAAGAEPIGDLPLLDPTS